MKERLIKLAVLILSACMLVMCISACGKDETKDSDTKKEIEAPLEEKEENTPKLEGQASDNAEENNETKYGKAEVYQKDGESYAKTDDGQEVELSGESLQDLMAAYEKVKGTGSSEEKDILNKIQLILEAPKN